MSLDLDRDVTINGHSFAAGKGVDTNANDVVDGKVVKNDYSQSIKDVLQTAKDHEAANKAAAEADPLEANKRLSAAVPSNPPVTKEEK